MTALAVSASAKTIYINAQVTKPLAAAAVKTVVNDEVMRL